MLVVKKQIALILLLSLFLVSHLFSNDKRRIVAVFTEFSDKTDAEGRPLLSPSEKDIIQQSLSYQLQNADFFAAFIEFPEKRNPETEEKRNYLFETGSDSWLSIVVSGNIDELKIKWELYDFIEEEVRTGGEFTTSGGAYYFQLFGGAWKTIIDELSIHLVPLEDSRIVRLIGKPGTVVEGLRDYKIELNRQGYIDVNLSLYTTYRAKISAPRTYNTEQLFYIDNDTDSIDLQQETHYGIHFDLFLNNLNYPGVNFKFYPTENGDDVYIGTSLLYHGLRITPLYPSESSQKMYYFNMQIGKRWQLGENNFFSAGISFFERGNLLYQEHVGIQGLEFELAPEIRLNPRFSLFASWNPRYYVLEDKWLFRSQVNSGLLAPFFFYFGDAGIELTNFKAGLRWIL